MEGKFSRAQPIINDRHSLKTEGGIVERRQSGVGNKAILTHSFLSDAPDVLVDRVLDPFCFKLDLFLDRLIGVFKSAFAAGVDRFFLGLLEDPLGVSLVFPSAGTSTGFFFNEALVGVEPLLEFFVAN